MKPSKSDRKRKLQALQQLGEKLIDLNDDVLDGLDLGERLTDAIQDARHMKSREALRRHKQYIGKLMRDVDPAPIHAVLDRLRADDRREKRIFANAERWRDRLISERDDSLSAFENETGADCNQLRELLLALDQATNDRDERTLTRKIFRHIHAALAAREQDR